MLKQLSQSISDSQIEIILSIYDHYVRCFHAHTFSLQEHNRLLQGTKRVQEDTILTPGT